MVDHSRHDVLDRLPVSNLILTELSDDESKVNSKEKMPLKIMINLQWTCFKQQNNK